ncbi:MAG: MFS transporter [Desulfobacteraceae bacterium]|nr:MFS transporter [Desulfobacteraceae bacterium]
MSDLLGVFKNRQFQNIAVCHFNTTFSTNLVMPILPVYLAGKGFVETQIGVIMGATAVAALLLRPWIGIQVDTRGSRPVLLLGEVLLFLSIVGLPWMEGMLSYVGLRVLYGVALALYGTGAVTFASSIGTGKTNSNAIAMYTLITMIGLGSSMSLAQVGFDSFGFTAVALAAAALLAVAFCVMRFRVRSSAVPVSRNGHAPFMAVLKEKAVLATALGQFGAMFAYGAAFTFVPLAAIRSGIAFYSFFLIAFAVSVVISRFFVQRIIEGLGLEKACVYAFAAMLSGMLVLLLPLSPVVLVVTGLSYGAGLGVAFPAFVILVVQRIEVENRGTSLGIMIAAGDIAMALSVSILGAIAQHLGYFYLFLATCLVLAACQILLYTLLYAQAPAGGKAKGEHRHA